MSEHPLEEARALLEMAVLEQLDFIVETPCEEPWHGLTTEGGCGKGPATHVLVYAHGRTHKDPCAPIPVLVCLDRAVFVRGLRDNTSTCPKCLAVGTSAEIAARVIGPINGKSAQ